MKRLNKTIKKQAVRYRHVVHEYDEEIYDFDELSPEAKENAINELRNVYDSNNYASKYMEMDAYDLKKYGDDFYIGMDLKSMGIPIDNANLYWDWTYAWLGGTTTLKDFLSLCDYYPTDKVVQNVVTDYINDYNGNDLDFETEYSVSQNDVIDYIDDNFEYYQSEWLLNGDKEANKQAFLDDYLDIITECLQRIFNDFNDKVQKANKWLTKIMKGYLDPSDDDLLNLMDIYEYEFDEDGYIV